MDLISKWGWEKPTPYIKKLEEHAFYMKNTLSGEILVNEGVISKEACDQLIKEKPQKTQTLDWFSSNVPEIKPWIDQILSFKNDYPYYDKLDIFTIHPAMKDFEVLSRADDLDCLLLLIEESKPLIVFSSFSGIIKYESLGREEIMLDPIHKILGIQPYLALAKREDILARLNALKSNTPLHLAQGKEIIWDSTISNTIEQKTCARIIDFALENRATDIAIDPTRSGRYEVKVRRDGSLIPCKSQDFIPVDLAESVLGFLMAISNANPLATKVKEPRDGNVPYRSSTGEVSLRFSFIPLNHPGDDQYLVSVSIRIFPRKESEISLVELGLDNKVIDELKYAANRSKGLVLVAGATNSGKSTTIGGLISAHADIYGKEKKRISIEHPLEQYLPGLIQINIPPVVNDIDKTWELILPHVKRHDPDVIWVGEIRDKYTADMCVASAVSGHMVLSTIHASHTVQAFDVLAKMVNEDVRYQLVEAITLIVAQRLVKKLCPKCKIIEAPTDEELYWFNRELHNLGHSESSNEHLKLPDEVAHPNTFGCSSCNKGYKGQIPINEVLPFTRQVKNAAIEMLQGKNTIDELFNARTMTMLQSGLNLINAHVCDVKNILFGK